MPTADQILVSLTYPPNLSLGLVLCAAIGWRLHWRVASAVLMCVALAWTLLWSIPQFSEWLRAPLERQFAVIDTSVLPRTDAIVVLGGGSIRPSRLEHSRLAGAARAWLDGRAPIVVLSGGGGRFGTGRGRSEAAGMADAIVTLGVPRSALVMEERSRDTEENASFTAALTQRRGIRSILLVTSSLHMPRASLLFREAGIETIPVPVPERSLIDEDQGDDLDDPSIDRWNSRWLPSRRALWRSGRALKEYAALLVVHAQEQPARN